MVTREECVAKGGKWDEVNQRCILKKPDEVAIKTKEGATRIQTPESLAADKRAIEIHKARQEAKETGRPSAQQALEAKEGKTQQAQELLDILPTPPTEEVPQPQVPEGQRIITQEEIDVGLTQADIDVGLSAASVGTVIPVEPMDLIGGFGKGVLASLFALGTKTAFKKGAPTLIKEGTGVLKSPKVARKITKGLKERLLSGAALGGAVLTGAALKSFTGADIAAIEQEVTKYGEIITKIPEAAKQGLSLEDGELVEYPMEKAVQDVQEIIDTLNDYEVELQKQSIGNAVLRLTGRYDAAQIEIDKQRREASLTMGKLIQEQINPSETRLDAQEVFRLIELQGLVKE